MKSVIIKFLVACVFVIGFKFPSLCQTLSMTSDEDKSTCSLTLSQSPQLRGFRLGMTLAQVQAILPKPKHFLNFATKPSIEYGEFGVTEISLAFLEADGVFEIIRSTNPIVGDKYEKRDIVKDVEGQYRVRKDIFPNFNGVQYIRLFFFENRISNIYITYDQSTKFYSMEDFTSSIAKSLNLSGVWFYDTYHQSLRMQCQGFGIGTYEGLALQLWDTAAFQTIEKRKKEKVEKLRREEEERRKVFKP